MYKSKELKTTFADTDVKMVRLITDNDFGDIATAKLAIIVTDKFSIALSHDELLEMAYALDAQYKSA